MNPSDLPDETLFEGALKCRTPAERAAYLDQACASKPELRRKLEILLEAHDQSGEFLEPPAAAVRPTIKLDLAPEEAPGTVIGRYKLLQKIGEGGMGVVYMAGQTEPVVRKVALKIIKLGMDTRQVVARFEAERQALALMDHPNIAKVLDAGTTATPHPVSDHPLPVGRGEGRGEGPQVLSAGRPYFVMELVHGVPITEYCDKNKLSTQQRLELFIPVCQAIQHAHQKGIIHRDIKPSNVMVTLHDGVPVPKVIDFGVAKATNQRLTEKTLFTHYAQMIGTPAYMSPEQAEMSGLDIDTRSDIYSLGVLLYELLTGSTPFTTKELLSKGYAEMQRIIAEQEPPKPSTRMSTLTDEQRTVVATHRNTEASALRKVLQGDLDWIVMKCLEKDRTRRYETSNGLAADLRRHLSNELITARPPTTGYLLKKLIKRNKATFVTASLVLSALVVGLGVATWQYYRQKAATVRAMAAERTQEGLRKQAEAQGAKSQQISLFLKAMFEGIGPEVAPGRDRAVVKEVLGLSVARAGKELADQPEVRAEVLHTIGISYHKLGEYRKAEEAHREALRLRREVFGQTNIAVAESLSSLGYTLMELRALSEAEACVLQAIAIQVKIYGRTNAVVAGSLTKLADVLAERGKTPAGLLREALAVLRTLPEPNQDLVDTLGLLALHCGSAAEREALNREGLTLSRQLKGESQDTATFLDRLARSSRDQGRLEEAVAMRREALAMRRKVLGNDHRYVCISLDNLSGLLQDQGKLVEAEALLREALATREKSFPDDWATSINRSRLGAILMDRKKYSEAGPLVISGYEGLRIITNGVRESAFEAALAQVVRYCDITNKTGGVTETDWYREQLAITRLACAKGEPSGPTALATLGRGLFERGKPVEGLALLREAAEQGNPDLWNVLAWQLATCPDPQLRDATNALRYALRAAAATNRKDPDALDTLAAAYAEAGEFEESLRVQQEAMALLKNEATRKDFAARLALYTSRSPYRDTLSHAGRLASATLALLEQEKFVQAETLARECLAIREKQIPDDWLTFNARSLLGGSLLGQGKYTEAEPMLLSGYEGMKERVTHIPWDGKVRLPQALERLVTLYEATGRPDKAAEWKQKLE